ncbi:MAG: hypothetical protein O7B26_10830, partial [Planctomycetota bacterium]|nr:hypothetical protein [Planctomycetota bacterium]
MTAFAALAMIGYLAAVFGLVSSPVAWLALGLVIGWFAGGRSVGRYQFVQGGGAVQDPTIHTSSFDSSSTAAPALLVDTKTGRVWRHTG